MKAEIGLCATSNICCVSLFALVGIKALIAFNLRLVEIITEMLQVMLDVARNVGDVAARLDVRCPGGSSSEVCLSLVTPDSECGLGPKRG